MDEKRECQIHEIALISKPDKIWLLIDRLGLRRKRALRRFSRTQVTDNPIDKSTIPSVLKLKKGELIEVRSEKEILATLDGSGKYKGLSLLPEMLKFCGKKLRVLKRTKNYIVEGKGMRILKNTVILDGGFCDGSWHGGCDRTCYCLWREKWLKRISTEVAT